MSAQGYGINFPYGATSAPYSVSRPHRGDDRPCPTGTPLAINGQVIGLTGATGFVTGPHLHIQEWNGSYANTRKPQNAFKPGTVVNVDKDATQGDRSFGKFISIQNADGWVDSYCHLSVINCNVGDKIGVTMSDSSITEAETDVLRIAHSEAGGWNLGEVHTGKYDKLFVDTYRGKSVSYMLRKQWENGSDWRDKRVAALNYFAQKPANDLQVKQLTDKTVELGKAVDLKQKEVDRLNAELAVQSDDTKLLNGFGEWLQKIIVRLGVKKG